MAQNERLQMQSAADSMQ